MNTLFKTAFVLVLLLVGAPALSAQSANCKPADCKPADCVVNPACCAVAQCAKASTTLEAGTQPTQIVQAAVQNNTNRAAEPVSIIPAALKPEQPKKACAKATATCQKKADGAKK